MDNYNYIILILVIFFALLYLSWILPGILVWSSAKKKGLKGTIWPWMGLLFGWLGWLIYVISKPEPLICPNCKKSIELEFSSCPHCGFLFSSKSICPNCKKEIESSFSFCPYCNEKLK